MFHANIAAIGSSMRTLKRNRSIQARLLSLIVHVLLVLLLLPQSESSSGEVLVNSETTVQFLLDHQKPNSAFGPIDQEHSDLAWNYPAVHALRLLGAEIPHREDCLKNGQWAAFRSKDSHDTNLYWDFYQKVRINLLLADDPSQAHQYIVPTQKVGPQGIAIDIPWTLSYHDRKLRYYGPYGLGKFHDLSSLWYMAGSLVRLGATVDNVDLANKFIGSRQSPCGAFVDIYGQNIPAEDADAHVVVTYHAIMTLKSLALPISNAEACAAWIQSCQTDTGGFRWSPANKSDSNQPDVWYTWAAVRALDALGHRPRDLDGCVEWLNSLQNSDSGFGDRPEWRSRLYSTYYAVHSLEVLTGDARTGIRDKRLVEKEIVPIPEGKYSIFQAQLKSPSTDEGEDNPVAMVEAVRKLGLDFIGVKANDVSVARAYVQSKDYPLEVVVCTENYHHHLRRRGGHPANHVSNWIIAPTMTADQSRQYDLANRTGMKDLLWPEFGRQVIAPMRNIGSLVYPEMEYSMISAYEVYDDGLDGASGYNAVVAGMGWPPTDWVRHFPYRDRWIGRLPMIFDCDAHGSVTEWRFEIQKGRTLYIAESHLLEAFLDACSNQRTVCAIRDEDISEGVVYYGSPAAVAYVKKHRDQWQWWKNTSIKTR